MRYKVRPADFIVEERLGIRLKPAGPYAVYRVRKRGTTTLHVQAQIAHSLQLAQSDVIFPALKDAQAIALQHASLRTTGPLELRGEGYDAHLAGYSAQPLRPADIAANHFAVVLRDLSPEDVDHVRELLEHARRHGLPNYFDEQRFGSLAPGEDAIGKRILLRDAEGALRAYLTQPFAGDTDAVRRFKRAAAGCWGDWQAMFEAAPRPSNYRSVLTFLRDHPTDDTAARVTVHRKALNLINQRLLSLYLAAYQSLLWNRIAGRVIEGWPTPIRARVDIAGEQLPLYTEPPPAFPRDFEIPLPHCRVSHSGPELQGITGLVLAEEGLTPADLKARILKKAYLTRGQRALLLVPADLSVSPPEPDELFAGRSKLTLGYTLPRGSYATLLLRVLST